MYTALNFSWYIPNSSIMLLLLIILLLKGACMNIKKWYNIILMYLLWTCMATIHLYACIIINHNYNYYCNSASCRNYIKHWWLDLSWGRGGLHLCEPRLFPEMASWKWSQRNTHWENVCTRTTRTRTSRCEASIHFYSGFIWTRPIKVNYDGFGYNINTQHSGGMYWYFVTAINYNRNSRSCTLNVTIAT